MNSLDGGTAVEVAEPSAGLGGDERAGGVVPRRQALLVVGVDPSRGDRAQVEGGRADAADVADLGEHLRQHLAWRRRRDGS